MNDPYQKAIEQLRDMIIELALRTLTVKEYQSFADSLKKKQEEEHE